MTFTDILLQSFEISETASHSRVGDEIIILETQRGTYYGLDPVGARIWDCLRQGATPLEACDLIGNEFKVARETIEVDARALLVELRDHGIIVAK